MGVDILLTLGANILSSIVYDIGKSFLTNGRQPLTEQQMIEIINSFKCELEEIYFIQSSFDNRLNYLQKQNEAILKLLLMIFDQNNLVTISYTENGYMLDGDLTLNHLDDEAMACVNNYIGLLPKTTPETLSEAVWPIPNERKGVLLDEIERTLYDEEE